MNVRKCPGRRDDLGGERELRLKVHSASIELMLRDVAGDRGWDEGVDGFIRADPPPDFAGHDVDQRRVNDMASEVLKLRRQGFPVHRPTGPGHDDEVNLVQQLINPMPLRQIHQHVAADEPMDSILARIPLFKEELSSGIDRVTWATAARFYVRDVEEPVALDRQSAHGQAILRRGEFALM